MLLTSIPSNFWNGTVDATLITPVSSLDKGADKVDGAESDVISLNFT